MLKLEVSKQARFDLRSTYYYMLKVGENPKAAQAFLKEFKRQTRMVMAFPEMRALCGEPALAARGVRAFPVTDSYLALYRVVGNKVYVWRIFHRGCDYAKLALVDLGNDWAAGS